MNRIEALFEVKTNIRTLMEKLQKSDPEDAINIADPFWDTECFKSLVDSMDESISWIIGEIESERAVADLKENESLPAEGNPGVAVGG